MHKQWIWQHPKWPKLTYDESAFSGLLYEYAKKASYMNTQLSSHDEPIRTEMILDIITAEALETSAIENEIIQPSDIRSSLKIQLGLDDHLNHIPDKRAEGIAAMMLQARNNFEKPLTKKMLFSWHELLMRGINPYLTMMVGHWRVHEDAMQIISGPYGREKVHYEAPPSDTVDKEMKRFIQWFNKSERDQMPGALRAAIAHLYFECIHPFQDGNGRIGRAVAEKALAQDLGSPVFYSLSTTINKKKKAYYDALSKNSKFDINITPWIKYFLKVVLDSQNDAKTIVEYTLNKAHFWKKHDLHLNDRQRKLLQRMFKEGIKGFEGGISANKYMKLLDVSKATATRDLQDLVKKGCLNKLPGAGRNTRYEINLKRSRSI